MAIPKSELDEALQNAGAPDYFTRRDAGKKGPYVNDKAEPNAVSWMNYLMKEMKLSKKQAAGIVANLQGESFGRLDPTAVGDGGVSGGVAQWNGPRWRELKEFAGSQKPPVPWNTTEIQQKFFKHEMDGKYKKVLDQVMQTDDPNEVVKIMVEDFEKPKYPVSDTAKRQKNLDPLLAGEIQVETTAEPTTPEDLLKELVNTGEIDASRDELKVKLFELGQDNGVSAAEIGQLQSLLNDPNTTQENFYTAAAAALEPAMAATAKKNGETATEVSGDFSLDIPLSGGAARRGSESSLGNMNLELRGRLAEFHRLVNNAVDEGLLPESARRVSVGSGYRSSDPNTEIYQQQLKAYRAYQKFGGRPVAHPDSSQHGKNEDQFGAADIAGLPKDGKYVGILRELAASAGLVDGVNQEKFGQGGMTHLEMAEKRGISYDGPMRGPILQQGYAALEEEKRLAAVPSKPAQVATVEPSTAPASPPPSPTATATAPKPTSVAAPEPVAAPVAASEPKPAVEPAVVSQNYAGTGTDGINVAEPSAIIPLSGDIAGKKIETIGERGPEKVTVENSVQANRANTSKDTGPMPNDVAAPQPDTDAPQNNQAQPQQPSPVEMAMANGRGQSAPGLRETDIPNPGSNMTGSVAKHYNGTLWAVDKHSTLMNIAPESAIA